MDFGDFYDLDPLPVAFKDMFPEELQAIAVNLDGTPGMGVNQIGKVLFSLFQGQLIGAAIKTFTDSTYAPRIAINGFLTFAIKFKQTQVTFIKFMKSVGFSFVHGILLFNRLPEIGHLWEHTLICVYFPPRSGFVQQ